MRRCCQHLNNIWNMQLDLKNPIVFFDIESTGLNIAKDRIIEISAVKVFPERDENGQNKIEVKTRRIRPMDFTNPNNPVEVPITPEAQAVHGISNEDLKDAPPFKQYAKSLANWMEGCDIAGYNSLKFDIPLLAEEFLRAGVSFDFRKRKLVDVQNIFHKMEQRTLVAAYKFYCHKDLTKAHSAEADTMATYEVLMAQLDKYNQESVEKGEYPIAIQNNIEWLADFSTKSKFVDYAGRIILNEKGEKIINFGKHKGKTVESVFETEPSYHAWIMNGDFTWTPSTSLTKSIWRS